jgi:hypothetical protein
MMPQMADGRMDFAQSGWSKAEFCDVRHSRMFDGRAIVQAVEDRGPARASTFNFFPTRFIWRKAKGE